MTSSHTKRLRDATEALIRYAAAHIDVPVNECVAGPIGEARAALADFDALSDETVAQEQTR